MVLTFSNLISLTDCIVNHANTSSVCGMLLSIILLLLYSTLVCSPLTSCSFQFPVTFHSTPKQKSCALFSNFCSLITTQLTAIFPQPCSLCIIIDPDHGCAWGILVLNSLYNPRRSYCKTRNSGLRSKEEKPRNPINQPSRCNAQEGLMSVAQTGDSDLLGGRAHRTANWASF